MNLLQEKGTFFSVMFKCGTHIHTNLVAFLFLSFFVEERGSFHGQVSLLTPATAKAGATVTLTLTVHALDSLQSNYAVTFLTVVPLVSNGDSS